jgi:putative transposase
MPRYHLFYHFVWTTKRRLPLINEGNEAYIYQTIRNKTDQLGGIVHALNGVSDHVHLVVTVPPVVSLSNLIGQIKGV